MPPTPAGKRYFFLLVDDYSMFMWVVQLTMKDKAAESLHRFPTAAEMESGHKLHTLRIDRGGEFTSKEFAAFCADRGTMRHLTVPYSPQQNGVMECRNQTIVGMVRSMLKAMNMPARFWGEAATIAVFVLNRSYACSVEFCLRHGTIAARVWMQGSCEGDSSTSDKAGRSQHTGCLPWLRTWWQSIPLLQS
jgi:transposase InsO family protein